MKRIISLLKAWSSVAQIACQAWLFGALATPALFLFQTILERVAVAFAAAAIIDGLYHGHSMQAALWTGVLGIVAVINGSCTLLVNKIQDVMYLKCAQEITQRLMKVLVTASGIEHLDSPEYADRLRIVRDRVDVPADIFLNLSVWISTLFTIVLSFVLLWQIHPLLLLFILLACPAALFQGAAMTREIHYAGQSIADERLSERFRDLALGEEGAKELRMLGLSELIVGRYRELRARVTRARALGRLQHVRPAVFGGLAKGLCLGGGLLFLVYLLGTHQATAAQIALGVTLLNGTLSGSISLLMKASFLIEQGWMAESLLALLSYRSPLKQPVKPLPCPEKLERGLCVEHVSFTYPGTEQPALQDVSLTLPAGATIALVGENGSGKTTLLKLLCRFYDPDEGRITVDGIDLRELALEAWRAQLTLVQQYFGRYHFLVRETVGVGDITSISRDARLLQAVQGAGADAFVQRLPAGLDTQLGTEFEKGRDLSGGQWQKLAIARAHMRRQPLITILDEPSASLDPKAEYEVYSRFQQLMEANRRRGGILFLVSHRLETTRLADVVIVLANGQVVEVGTHQQLLDANKTYAELYRLKMQILEAQPENQ